MRVPFINLTPQYQKIKKEVWKHIAKVADSQRFILGEYGAQLEEKIAKRCGVPYAVGLASGSDALLLSLLALGIGPGDEVITTPFTFFASAGSITRSGARVVFCDIDPETYNLDPKKIESKITSRTKAILPVHIFGLSCDMGPMLQIAKKHGLSVIEDAAQSFGAFYDKKPSGSLGDIGCFSFYPTKNLGGAGDGGMVVTRSLELANKIKLLRNHGSEKKYYHEVVGMNSRLDEMQAAWLLVKLKYIDQWNKSRNAHAQDYDNAFKGLPVKTPFVPKNCVSNYHLYSIQTADRDALSRHLNSCGIGNGVYYPLPLHLQPCYRSLGYKKGDFPVSESVSSRILSLPMYAEMSSKEKKAVIQSVQTFFKKGTRKDPRA